MLALRLLGVPVALVSPHYRSSELQAIAAGTGLAAYKVPQRPEIRDELPRGANGKARLRPDDFAPD